LKKCIVTMAFNERFKLPRWVEHHLNYFDPKDIYILDHGSTDDSLSLIKKAPINVINIPRNEHAHDPSSRTRYVSDFVNSKLTNYAIVGYVDADELLVYDESQIQEFYESEFQSLNAIGFDVLHDEGTEPGLTAGNFVSLQRKYLKFNLSLCKPIFVKSPVNWTPGFHYCNFEPNFASLYLMHLRYVDIFEGITRLQETRNMNRPNFGASVVDHHKISDETFKSWVRHWLSSPKTSESIFESIEINSMLSTIKAASTYNGVHYPINYSESLEKIFLIPKELYGRF